MPKECRAILAAKTYNSLDLQISTSLAEIRMFFICFNTVSTFIPITLFTLQFKLYLDCINLPKLTKQQNLKLDVPIVVEEMMVAIRSFPKHKTLELDGFPVEWYVQFHELISTKPLDIYNQSFQTQWGRKLFLLILRPGNDLLCCDSYQTIVLIKVVLN